MADQRRVLSRPERYLAFGHDEESQGKNGAGAIAQWLEAHDVKPEFILDEGSFVITDALDGLEKPLAAIAVTEKVMFPSPSG